MKYRTTSDRRKGAAISSFSDLPSLFPFNPNPIRSRSNRNSPFVPSATSTATQLLYQLIPRIFIRIYPLQFFFTREVWSKLGRMQQRNRVKSKLEELNHICTATNGGEFRFCGN
ncbi:unnamed protein product [Lactuca virosa]|uniref:Uncharacterized protein n=1 Tax=Lactuca virosa TaxID=75947 RepID=A0AAU9NGN9_9ASTR|nr:unnamed protein product [Lactuca virosa]